MSTKKIYKHLPTGRLLLLLKTKVAGINVFLECDQQGNAIIKKRSWSTRPQEQRIILKNCNKLHVLRGTESQRVRESNAARSEWQCKSTVFVGIGTVVLRLRLRALTA